MGSVINRLSMKGVIMLRSHVVTFLLLLISGLVNASETAFVKDGKVVNAVEVGSWTKADGALIGEGVDMTFLYGNGKIGSGDFRITAKLKLDAIDGSAAALCLGNNATHFGFDGQNRQFFVNSPYFERLFGEQQTRFQKIDGLIEAGKPFHVVIERKGDFVKMIVQNRELFSFAFGDIPMGTLTLRPHRARMHVYDFAFDGNLQPFTEEEKNALTVGEKPMILDFVFSGEVSHQILFRERKENDGYNHIRIPAICMTKQGTLLAFAEGRIAGDTGKIEMLLRRSEDNGKTWSPIQVIWKDGDNTCGNPAPVCDMDTGTVWLLTTWNHGLDHEGQIMDGQSRYPRIPYILKSDDDGKTWSEAKPLPHLRKDHWGWYATGPCNGIQLTHGLHKGRLVIPANHSVVDIQRPRNDRYYSHIIYSDDHGVTWKLGGIDEMLTNESTVVELTDGSVMQNMRSYHGRNCRAVAISRNGGESLPTSGVLTGSPGDDAYLDATLDSPVCQASILRYNWPGNSQSGTILYSGPWGTARSKLTVWMSEDDAKSWSHRQLIFNGPAAYSNLVALPDGQVGLLAEIGTQTPYDTISFLTFPLSWVASAEKPEDHK